MEEVEGLSFASRRFQLGAAEGSTQERIVQQFFHSLGASSSYSVYHSSAIRVDDSTCSTLSGLSLAQRSPSPEVRPFNLPPQPSTHSQRSECITRHQLIEADLKSSNSTWCLSGSLYRLPCWNRCQSPIVVISMSLNVHYLCYCYYQGA